MKPSRRHFLRLAGAAVALPAVMRTARAQTYPTRLVRLIVGYPPGGASDIMARLMGQWLSERFAQPFIIENRSGAAGNIATEAVVNASPDGYTLLLVNQVNTVNATLYDKLSFNFIRDIAPISGIIRGPFVVVVNPSFPAKTIPELIAYARANPDKINMASSGNGTGVHVSGELFKMMTGINMVHVPYRGGAPAMTDLLGGQVQVMFATLPSTIGYIKSRNLRALAVTTVIRSEALPDTPCLSDYVPGYEASDWYGIGAPKATATEIIAKLNKEVGTALADPKIKARLAELGGKALGGSAADFGTLIVDETEKWGKVINLAGIKPG